MTVLFLIRHAVADHTGKRVYGRAPGVHLSLAGRAQAAGLAKRLLDLPLEAVYSSPLERCRETAAAIASGRALRARRVADLNEVDYGQWVGRSFAQVRRTSVWKLLRRAPSRVRFPGGETLGEVQERTIRALERIAGRHRGAVAVVTHGDVIRLALAHYGGVHIDLFERFEVSTASVSVVELGDARPRILRVNDAGSLDDLMPRRGRRGKVGG